MTQRDTLAGAGGLDWKEYWKKPEKILAAQVNMRFKVKMQQEWVVGRPGDWLIETPGGKCSLCRDDVFQATYDEVQ